MAATPSISSSFLALAGQARLLAASGARFALALLLCLVALAPLGAAEVSLCESAALSGNEGTQMYGPEGELLVLRVAADAVATEACVDLQLPLPLPAVRWFSLTDIPPESPPERLSLQGYFDERAARVSEVIHQQQQAQVEPGFLPFYTDMQANLDARAFGIEERAHLDGRDVVCGAGEQIAGIVLRPDGLVAPLPGMELRIAATGTGTFRVAIADAERERRDNPYELGALVLDGGVLNVSYVVPDAMQRWTSLTIICPQAAATLTLSSMMLVPPQGTVRVAQRATWLWSPQLWLHAPEAVWRLAEQEQLGRIYVTVPLAESGGVANAEAFAHFVAEATTRNIAVWAVIGDRADVVPENLTLLLQRVDAYRRYNAEHADTPLAGLQLDIEPYLLPGSTLAPDYWRERYVATISAVHRQLAQQLPLDLVMPVWWGLHPAWGSRLLDALVLPGLSVTVMNYRTDGDVLRAGATPFLAWGLENDSAVAMALEKGRIGVNAGDGRDERRTDYARADAGELWMLELGGISLLVLLDKVYEDLPGQAYLKSAERKVSTGDISFADAPENLQALAATLEAEWSAWDSFAGLAIHGLDQDLELPPPAAASAP
ncbi:MAG: hypothetical protein RLZZ227_95 [Pseudomonadota bacterium]|jgi:hypothetical protein